TPVINQPQSAILGTSTVVERPVVVDGEIVIRPIMPVSFTFDHRVMDGSQPGRFLGVLAALLEDTDTLWVL
ncbi:MAG: 2-oxo acid dehydrogenase subunit E2, partial [Deltaproteobacteria bacterium]|nr:2-oxo acid dehydrogenase subunit E2 [Deltaproteobacteria bacterium]